MRPPRPFLRGILAFLAVPALASAALAQSVHEVIPGGDTVTGEIASPGEVDRIPIRLVEGVAFSLSLKAAKGSALLPEVVLLGTDRRPDAAAGAAVVVAKKGNALSIKKLPVAETALRWLEVRGASGSTGGWILATKTKAPKGAVLAAARTAGAPTDIVFPVPGNATASLSASAPKGSADLPVFDLLLDPDGGTVLLDDLVDTKAGFSIPSVYLAKPGRYVLRLAPGTSADAVAFKAKWKVPKPFKRALTEGQVICDPVALSVDPEDGETSDTFPAAKVTVDFARPGAKVSFRKEPTVVTISGAAVVVAGDGITFPLSLASFQKGTYDVEVLNPDGGKDVLPGAFEVRNAAARPTSVSPGFGYDNQVVTITVTGTFLNSGATLALARGAETIPGTGVSGAGSMMQGQFDLRSRTPGLWDLVVSNPDAAPAVLAGAFEVRNSPPSLAGISPSHNIDDAAPVCTITGSDLDPTPSAVLRRAGEPDLQGTSALWVSGTEIRATFDTAGAAVGAWDLVVTNPDGQSATLPAAFRTSGAVGSPSKVAGTTNPADLPPSAAYGATRDEFVLAWVEVGTSSWTVYAQRVDAEGVALGSPAAVSASSSTVPKRDAAVGWDSTNDQFLVAWCEPWSINLAGQKHPSANYTSVWTVKAQRLASSDLALLGSNVHVTDHTLDPSSWYLDEFNNFRPEVLWDPSAKAWAVVWMQEWDTNGLYSYDDFDVLSRALDPAGGGSLGSITQIAVSSVHEGDPSACWDPGQQRVLVAYNYRGSATSPLDVRLAGGGTVASDSSADLVDPRIAYDPDAKRVLVCWTRKPATGDRTVAAQVVDGTSLGTLVGAPATVGTGSGEHHDSVRVAWNPALKEGMIAWHRDAGSSSYAALCRRVTVAGSSGLAFVGARKEASAGSGAEGMPNVIVLSQAGETAVLWAKTLTFASVNGYPGSLHGGTWRGRETWIQRYR